MSYCQQYCNLTSPQPISPVSELGGKSVQSKTRNISSNRFASRCQLQALFPGVVTRPKLQNSGFRGREERRHPEGPSPPPPPPLRPLTIKKSCHNNNNTLQSQPQQQQRPKTAQDTHNSYAPLSNVLDRSLRVDSPASGPRISLQKIDLLAGLSTGKNTIQARKPKVLVVPLDRTSRSRKSDECDLEFLNKSFNYDDSASVIEFNPEDTPVPRKCPVLDSRRTTTGRNNNNNYTSSPPPPPLSDRIKTETAEPSPAAPPTGLIKSVARLLGRVEGCSSNIFSSVTSVGAKLIRGVTDVLFQDPAKDSMTSVFEYNGYSIRASGQDLIIHSIFLGGLENQKLRVYVWNPRPSNNVAESPPPTPTRLSSKKSKFTVSSSSVCWLLSWKEGDPNGRSATIEVRVPSGVPLKGIKVQGPYQGFLCLNIP